MRWLRWAIRCGEFAEKCGGFAGRCGVVAPSGGTGRWLRHAVWVRVVGSIIKTVHFFILASSDLRKQRYGMNLQIMTSKKQCYF